jgi:alcohol dehydrogenase
MAASLQRAHFGGRVVWVGITAEAVPLDDALLHRRELSLHASRNARPADFPRILGLMNEGRLQVQPWISERCALRNLPEILPQWLEPQRAVVKAVALVD